MSSSTADGGPGSNRPEGGPAIKPHPGSGGPAYTTEDAVQYVLAHPPARLTPLAPATLVRAEFMSAQAVGELLPGSSIGMPDTDLLCYVELQGHWRLYNQFGPPREFIRVAVVFDAYTGNHLLTGAMP